MGIDFVASQRDGALLLEAVVLLLEALVLLLEAASALLTPLTFSRHPGWGAWR